MLHYPHQREIPDSSIVMSSFSFSMVLELHREEEEEEEEGYGYKVLASQSILNY